MDLFRIIIVAVIQVPLDQLPNNCSKKLLLGPTASHKPNVPRHRHCCWIILYARMMRRLNTSPANMAPIFWVQLLWWPKLWSSLPRSPFPSCLRLLWSPFKSFHPFLPLQAVTAVAAAGNILTVFHQNPSTDQDPSINSEPLFFTMMLFLTMRRSTEPILWRKPSVLLTTYTVPILILHCTKSRKQRSLLPFMLFLLALCLSIWVIWSLPMTMVLHVLHPRFTVSYISPGVIILHQSIYEILNGALLHLFCTKIKFTHHNKTF